jgi:transposase-like protein
LEDHGVMADIDTGSTGRASPRKYPPELKQRAIRMVLDAYDRGEERFGTVTRIANELGIGPESLRRWVVQAEIDRGRLPAPPARRPGASASWSGRTASCGGPTRSSSRHRRIRPVDATPC